MSSSVAFHPIWVLGIELRFSSLHGSILPAEASLQPLTWLTCVYSHSCGGTYICGTQSTYHLRCSHSSIIHHCFLRQCSHWSGAHQLEEAGYPVSYKNPTISTSLALEYKCILLDLAFCVAGRDQTQAYVAEFYSLPLLPIQGGLELAL